jgi:hypothetical protein
LIDLTEDPTASSAKVGTSGTVAVFKATRTPPRGTVVLVVEPIAACFVVYSPMP